MMLRVRPITALSAITAFLILLPAAFAAQPAPAQPSVKRDIARPIQSVQGKDMYREYCAVCHGVDGKGHGPAAPAMKVPPTDLTTYAKRHGGQFSEMDMRMVIEGQDDMPAHGSRDMPIWGDVFRALTHDREMREMRMKNLIDYLKTMQVQ
jgi:mono/diheme cytochrome c family protein